MGMTIDNCIKDLLIQREDFTYELGSEEIDFMIAIMQKYQKIQEIYERFQKDGNYYHHMAWIDVMEVLKDGNDD